MQDARFHARCSSELQYPGDAGVGGTVRLHHHNPFPEGCHPGNERCRTECVPQMSTLTRFKKALPSSASETLVNELYQTRADEACYRGTIIRNGTKTEEFAPTRHCSCETHTGCIVEPIVIEPCGISESLVKQKRHEKEDLHETTKGGSERIQNQFPKASPNSCSGQTSGTTTNVQSENVQSCEYNSTTRQNYINPQSEKITVEASGELTGDGQCPAQVKPPLSYIGLIAKAIMESPQNRLSLGSIYSWIESNYPYYRNRGQGWRNSVRHNLSLNDCFIKAGRCEDGKGNYWAIHPANLQDFMRGDFRQRRRSRRRGRRKEVEMGMFHMGHNGYLGTVGGSLPPTVNFNSSPSLNAIYSPYTEAERRAYRLDEALLRQSMNNPFVKWYNGMNIPFSGSPSSSALYSPGLGQWQGYPEGIPTMYQFQGISGLR